MYEYGNSNIWTQPNYTYVYPSVKWRKKTVTEVQRYYDEQTGNLISETETITETEEPYYDSTWTSGTITSTTASAGYTGPGSEGDQELK